MLSARLNDTFQIVSWKDPAFDNIDDTILNQYIQTRDISILELEKLEVQPSVFECLPLQTEYEHLTQMALTDNTTASWRIFQTHVKSASNFNHPNGKQILKWKPDAKGNQIIDDECRKHVHISTYTEIPGVIVEKANKGDYGPFVVPDTFARDRIRLRARLAISARIGSAKQPNTE